MRELSPLLTQLSGGGIGGGEVPSSNPLYPHQSTAEAGGKAGLEVIRVGELPLFPISYNSQEIRPCTSSGQHNRANPVGRGVGELALKL